VGPGRRGALRTWHPGRGVFCDKQGTPCGKERTPRGFPQKSHYVKERKHCKRLVVHVCVKFRHRPGLFGYLCPAHICILVHQLQDPCLFLFWKLVPPVPVHNQLSHVDSLASVLGPSASKAPAPVFPADCVDFIIRVPFGAVSLLSVYRCRSHGRPESVLLDGDSF